MAGDLQGYFKAIGKTRLLSKEEEVELSKKIEKGDMRARDRMIRANMRLAISIAKKFSNKGCNLEDLIQESSLGLIKAVDRYDWRRGFKFSTYASWWIKQAVRQFIAAQGGSIKLPAYARNTLYKMRLISEEYEKEFGVAPTQQEIADILGTTKSTIASFVACAAHPVELDAQAYRESDSGNRKMHEVLASGGQTVEEKLDHEKLVHAVRDAISNLSPREAAVLRLRFGISENKEVYANANA
jgi:RNA polymerase primary sigma factor